MNEGRKFSVINIHNGTLAATLRRWIVAADATVSSKVNQFELDLWLWGHSHKMKITQHKKPQFRWMPMPAIDQSYSEYVPQQYKDCPPQIFRNAVVYRFYQPWQLHLQDPKHFGYPSKDKPAAQSVLLTSELFTLKGDKLIIYDRGKKIGILHVKVHQKFSTWPKMVHITWDGKEFWVSFSFDNQKLPPTAEDIVATLLQKYAPNGPVADIATIEADANARDYGVKIGAIDKDGIQHGWTDALWQHQLNEMERVDQLNQAQSYKKIGGSKYRKLQKRIDTTQERINRRVQHVNHKGSQTCAQSHGYLQGIEDTNWAGLMRKNKAIDNGYAYEPNGQAAKRALNRKLRARSLGDLQQKTEYKIEREHKLPVWVNPHGTSCTCIHCGDRHQDNRPSQGLFLCRKCKETGNADHHAAQYMSHRTAHIVQFVVYAIQWMATKKLSGGTSVYHYLLSGSRRKTARVCIKEKGLVQRVKSVFDSYNLWEDFCKDVHNPTLSPAHQNLLVVFGCPH